MSDVADIERQFWAEWRMRWVPRVSWGIAGFLVLLASSLMLPDIVKMLRPPPRPVAPAPAVPKEEAITRLRCSGESCEALFLSRAKIHAQICHSWLTRWAKNAKDSLSSYHYHHTDPVTGLNLMCINWLVYAGEKP